MIYGFTGKHRFLSNFYPLPYGTTAEHLYQAAKAMTDAERRAVLDAPGPSAAKRRGRRVRLRPNWDAAKYGVMLDVLRTKFSHPELAALLLDTGEEELVEANDWHDEIWGVDRTSGRGANLLGKALMHVRAEIRSGALQPV